MTLARKIADKPHQHLSRVEASLSKSPEYNRRTFYFIKVQ